ncbi:S66 peptidase family protein [Microlunatus speluncae]|uniref:S66 peptidase family protein n=1 Tax=Microlunatus speluncae TaxID=2594267 RepID=UPI001266755F|nr:LD-carboxypeptidase [Microlunatus speluncae]
MTHPPRQWPEPLRPGSVVAVVAPSGPIRPERLQRGVDLLQSWGLVIKLGPNTSGVHDRLGYLSADDQARAAELTAAWSDPEVAAVWAARGGYGAQRMIDLIDFDALRAAGPKHFLGFSDITALHDRIGRELDQVTLHSPAVAAAVAQLADPPSVEQLRRLIFEPAKPGTELATGSTLVPGTAQGLLIGGNLALVASSLGVDPAPDRPSILFLEDIDEEGYRVDRMLTQLLRSGWLSAITGIIIGQFTDTDDEDQLQRLFEDRFAGLGVPVITGVEAGHGERNLTLPLGAEVTLTAGPDGGSLVLGRPGR